jgi:hypothetical protein
VLFSANCRSIVGPAEGVLSEFVASADDPTNIRAAAKPIKIFMSLSSQPVATLNPIANPRKRFEVAHAEKYNSTQAIRN